MSIIAVGFDGVICVSEFPNIGRPHINVIDALIKRRKKGDKLILWTCRHDKLLDDAVAFCRNMGLEFDAVNENLDFMIEKYGESRKIGADYYLDDKSVTPEWLFAHDARAEPVTTETRRPTRIIRR